MDIAIAVTLGLVTLGIAYLGIHLTIHPPKSRKGRIGCVVTFVVLAVAAVAITGWQTYRNVTNQNELREQLGKIEQNTKQPPVVQVSPQINIPPAQVIVPPRKERSLLVMDSRFITKRMPPFTSTNSFVINIGYQNRSNVPAHVRGLWSSVYRFDHLLSAEEENRLHAQIRSAAKSKGELNEILGPGQRSFITLDPKPYLNDGEADLLSRGKLYYYVMSLVKYDDDLGTHETDLCRIFWGVEPAIHNCRGNNGPRS